jgi:hypothetical protein
MSEVETSRPPIAPPQSEREVLVAVSSELTVTSARFETHSAVGEAFTLASRLAQEQLILNQCLYWNFRIVTGWLAAEHMLVFDFL